MTLSKIDYYCRRSCFRDYDNNNKIYYGATQVYHCIVLYCNKIIIMIINTSMMVNIII